MKKLVVVLAIAVLAFGIGAGYLWQQLGASRSQIAGLQAHVQQLEAAQRASAAAPQFVARNAGSAAAPAAPVAAPKAAVAVAASTTTALVEEMRKQMTSPEGRDVRRAQRRMFLTQQYPDVGKWLNLTRDEEDKLLDLIAKQESDQSEAVLNPANRGDPAAQQATARNMLAQRQANDADLAAMLGSKYPQFQEYQQTLPVHRQVSQLQAMLGAGADGLSDAQNRSLTTALVAEQVRINQERSGLPPATQAASIQDYMHQQQQRTVENNRRLLEVAATQLNPQQLDSYRNLIEEQERTSSMLSRTLDAAQAQAGSANAPAAR